jgi:hypothetical protein
MKKFVAVAAFAALAGAAFAQSTPQNQLDLGFGFYDTDPTGVYKDFQSAATKGAASKFAPTVNQSEKYTYTLPADTSTYKFALANDTWYGLYNGASTVTGGTPSGTALLDTAYNGGQYAGKVTPAVEWLGFGADVTLSLPVYYFSPNQGGINTLKYAYKEAGYLPIATSSTVSGHYSLNHDSVIATTQLNAVYKYSFDKTTWVSGGVSGQLSINPVPVLFSVLPKVSAAAFGAQLDVQFDDYNSPGNYNAVATAYATASELQKGYSDFYLEPKLTYDLGFVNLVTGLKAYVSSRIALATTNPLYQGDNIAAGKDQKFHDTYVQPGLNYAFAVPGLGGFVLDAGWRFAKIDNVGSVKGSNSGLYTGTDTETTKDVAPYSDLRVALTYTAKY